MHLPHTGLTLSLCPSSSLIGKKMAHAALGEEGESSEVGCEGCRTWQQEIYWNHFRTFHFIQILPKDFQHHLAIPQKFARNAYSKVPTRVSLKGPSGATWDVNLKVNGDVMCFVDGWEEFAKASSLQENDTLLFKYNGGSCFNVLIFNGKNLCERESSYFVRKCGHEKNEKKRDTGHITSDEEDSEWIPIKRRRMDARGKVVERQDGSQGNPLKEPVENGGTGQIDGDMSQSMEPGAEAAEKSPTPVGSLGAPSKQPGGHAAAKSGIHDCSNPMKSLSPKGRGRPSSRITPSSSRKAVILHSEDGKGANGRKSASTLQTKSAVNGHASGRSPPLQVSRHPNGQRKPMRSDSSVELTAGSAEEISSSEAEEESSQDLPTSNEQSAEDEGYTARTAKRTPKGKGGQKIAVRRKTLSPKGVRPSNSAEPRVRSATPNSSVVGSENRTCNRRPVTETERKQALQLASKEQTDASFIKIMLPTHVYRHFHMPVPADWIEEYMTPKDQEVTLRVGKETWSVQFNYGPRQGDSVLGSGWKKFVVDNSLEESDVCLFKPASQKDEAVILDVKIFRVVQEVTPPTVAAIF